MEITRETIMENINNPELLEELYNSNKKLFSNVIFDLYSQESNLGIKYWYMRLSYKKIGEPQNNTSLYIFTAFLILFSWIPVRLVQVSIFAGINFKDSMYLINAIPVIFAFSFSLYYLFRPLKIKHIVFSFLMNITIYVYFILLPDRNGSQSLTNAFYFMFILLWFFVLFAQSKFKIKDLGFSSFLEITGEMIIWTALFILGGIVIVGLSLALFKTIGINAEEFYIKNIVTLGLTASPFVSLLVIDNIKRIKLSQIMANIFLPIILVSIISFGIISLFTKTKPYEDRDIFILYNIMMIIVICVLVFTSINDIKNKIINICVYVLPIVTIILDIITISATIYRLNKYGITANKITLLGTNLIMLGHLIYITFFQVKHVIVQNVKYLPAYAIWALCIVFIFPFIFSFK